MVGCLALEDVKQEHSGFQESAWEEGRRRWGAGGGGGSPPHCIVVGSCGRRASYFPGPAQLPQEAFITDLQPPVICGTVLNH